MNPNNLADINTCNTCKKTILIRSLNHVVISTFVKPVIATPTKNSLL